MVLIPWIAAAFALSLVLCIGSVSQKILNRIIAKCNHNRSMRPQSRYYIC